MKVPLKNFPFQRFGLTYCELSHWKFKPNWNANELAIIFYGRIGMFKHTVFRLKGLIQFSGRLPKWERSEFHRFIVKDDGDYYYYYQHYSDEFKKIGACDKKKCDGMGCWTLARVRLKAICALHWKRTSWAHKRPFIVCSNNVTLLLLSHTSVRALCVFAFEFGEKREKHRKNHSIRIYMHIHVPYFIT